MLPAALVAVSAAVLAAVHASPVVPAASRPGAATVLLPLGDGEVPFDITAVIRTERGGTFDGPLAWRTRADGALEGRASGDAWELEVAFVPVPGGAGALHAALRWRRPDGLEQAAVRLAWASGAGPARAVDRNLRFGPLVAPLRVERGTPLLVAAGPVVLTGGPGLAAARLVPRATSARGPRAIEVQLFLDDAAARPFSTYLTCLDALPDAEPGHGLPWGALERRRSLVFAPRAAGDVDALRAQLAPDAGPDVGSVLRPVIVERWPAGARAAVVFTDHADRTDPAALRAVLWGDSDPRAEGASGAGFLGRGVRVTRTFFVRAGAGGLEDPETQLLADDLSGSGSGSEVGLHSITGGRDGREVVRAGLLEAAPWRPAVWIDHQPYTNCEAVSSQGWQAGGAFGVRDLLVGAGIRWLWAAGDLGPGATRVVDLLGGAPDEVRAALYPFPLDARLWVFRSSMFFDAPEALAAALAPPALDALEASRGLFVAHTYLGPSARTTHGADHLRRLAVKEVGRGHLVVDPALDAALARISARVYAGRLASLAWATAGDRLRALGDVEVAYRPDGAAELRNHGAAAIEALTVAVPAGDLALALEGAFLIGREDGEDGMVRLWFDLPAGGRVVLRASDRFHPAPFVSFR